MLSRGKLKLPGAVCGCQSAIAAYYPLFAWKLIRVFVVYRWDQGLLDMCIGEKRTLTIPPEFGYGDRGVGPIPGGATLVFETELVGIDGVKDEL